MIVANSLQFLKEVFPKQSVQAKILYTSIPVTRCDHYRSRHRRQYEAHWSHSRCRYRGSLSPVGGEQHFPPKTAKSSDPGHIEFFFSQKISSPRIHALANVE